MRLAPLFALAILAPAFAGCIGGETSADVVATVYPVGFLAERLAGPDVTVATLVPAGVEPHDWEPSTSDITRVAEAKLMLAQGAGFEPWLDGFRQALGDRAPPLVFATANVPLAEGDHAHDEEEDHADEAHGEQNETRDAHDGQNGTHDAHDEQNETHDEAHNETHDEQNETHEAPGTAPPAAEEDGTLDPHAWLDPTLFAGEARNVAAALEAAFPADADGIQARLVALLADLDALHEEYEAGLASCEIDVIIANHDAYGYLARQYGFRVVAISGLSPEAEPSPRAITRAIEEAREHGVEVIFFEELVSPRVAEVVAEEIGAETRVLSPVESLTPDQRAAGGDYLSLMRQNLVHLHEAMRCA